MGKERYRVFVKSGVTAESTEELLKQHFSTFGAVTDVYIPRSMPGHVPKGFAYISFESEDGVQRAVTESVHEIKGKHYPVGRAEPRPSERNTWHRDERKQAKMHEPVLPWHDRNQRSLSPMRAMMPGPLGLGPPAVDFRGPGPMLGEIPPYGQAFPMYDGYGGGRGPVPGGITVIRNDRVLRSSRIFVGGIPDVLVERHIRAHFMKYGTVEDVYFPREKITGKRRGFCFVRFDTPGAADVAAARSPRTIQGHEIGEIKVAEMRREDMMNGGEPVDIGVDVDRFGYHADSFRGPHVPPPMYALPRPFDGRPPIRYRPY